MSLLDEPPLSEVASHGWSLNQLRKLGHAIRDGVAAPEGCPEYHEVLRHYARLALAVLQTLDFLDWDALLEDRPYRITARAKTIDTLREKLIREESFPLHNIQDIAGVRFEAEMSLEEQDVVAMAICEALGGTMADIHDLRVHPHSGYRAVHLKMRLPQGRVEIQVRTHIQGAWANAYEAAADLWGREIRYGQLPADPSAREIVEQLQALSIKSGTFLELMRNQYQRRRDPIPIELRDQEERFVQTLRDVENRLRRLAANR